MLDYSPSSSSTRYSITQSLIPSSVIFFTQSMFPLSPVDGVGALAIPRPTHSTDCAQTGRTGSCTHAGRKQGQAGARGNGAEARRCHRLPYRTAHVLMTYIAVRLPMGCCALSCGKWHTARPCEPDQFVAVSIQVYVCWVFSQKRNAAAMQCREQANDGASHKTTCARKSNPRKALHRRDLVWWRVRCTPVQPSAWAWHQCLNDKECDRRCPADRGSFKAPASCARHLS